MFPSYLHSTGLKQLKHLMSVKHLLHALRCRSLGTYPHKHIDICRCTHARESLHTINPFLNAPKITCHEASHLGNNEALPSLGAPADKFARTASSNFFRRRSASRLFVGHTISKIRPSRSSCTADTGILRPTLWRS